MKRAWPIAALFLFICLSRIDDGGTNAMARFATLRAMAAENTFRIDRYHDWTQDVARTPDGHYYSNKAPGPTLIAFPLFWIIDKALAPVQNAHLDEKGRPQAPRGIHKVAVSTSFQVIPYLVFSLLIVSQLGALTPSSILVTLLALLFGNTAAVMMSTYMGNPFAGMALLAFAYFYLTKRLSWASFSFGWVVLAGYENALLVIPFMALMLSEARERAVLSVVREIVVGAALPATLWVWYHVACFGSPFSLPFQYDVETLLGKVDGPGGLWGVISFLPRPRLVGELLWGPARGILFTQPWMLFSIFAPFFWRPEDKRLARLFYFSIASLFLLVWINSGYPGWHGGGNPGPRYLAAALPLLAIFIPSYYEKLPPLARALFLASLAAALLLRGLVYATWMLADPTPIWPYYLSAIRTPKEWLMLAIYFSAFAMALYSYWQNKREFQPLGRA